MCIRDSVRESGEESVLVVAARSAAAVELPVSLGEPLVAFGEVRLEASDAPSGGAVTAITDGPAFGAWALPGVAAPAW